MNKKRGFTLIEILTVISIMAVLLSIAVPSFQYHLKRAKRLKALNEGVQLYNAFMTYYREYPKALSYVTASDFIEKISGEAPQYINIYNSGEIRTVIRYSVDNDLYTLEVYPQKNHYFIKDQNNEVIYQ